MVGRRPVYDDDGLRGPGKDPDDERVVRHRRAISRRMRLRNTWQQIMEDDGMPFVQTTAPLKVFEMHIKELTEMGISDEGIISSWASFAVDARRGLIKRNTNPWFAYWGRRSRYIKIDAPEQEPTVWDDDDEEPTDWYAE